MLVAEPIRLSHTSTLDFHGSFVVKIGLAYGFSLARFCFLLTVGAK